MNLLFLAVPLICEPLCGQPISHALVHYEYIAELDLAEYSCGTEQLEIDMLIDSNNYWKLVTAKLISKSDGPTADQDGCCQDQWKACSHRKRIVTLSLQMPYKGRCLCTGGV